MATPGTPEAPPPESDVDEASEIPAGLQELRDPDFLEGIPEPDLSRPRVLPEDFRGGGLAGGGAGELSASRVLTGMPEKRVTAGPPFSGSRSWWSGCPSSAIWMPWRISWEPSTPP